MKVVFTTFGRILVMLCPKVEHLSSAGHINNETRSVCLGAGPGGGYRRNIQAICALFLSCFTFQAYNVCFLISRLIVVCFDSIFFALMKSLTFFELVF